MRIVLRLFHDFSLSWLTECEFLRCRGWSISVMPSMLGLSSTGRWFETGTLFIVNKSVLLTCLKQEHVHQVKVLWFCIDSGSDTVKFPETLISCRCDIHIFSKEALISVHFLCERVRVVIDVIVCDDCAYVCTCCDWCHCLWWLCVCLYVLWCLVMRKHNCLCVFLHACSYYGVLKYLRFVCDFALQYVCTCPCSWRHVIPWTMFTIHTFLVSQNMLNAACIYVRARAPCDVFFSGLGNVTSSCASTSSQMEANPLLRR